MLVVSKLLRDLKKEIKFLWLNDVAAAVKNRSFLFFKGLDFRLIINSKRSA